LSVFVIVIQCLSLEDDSYLFQAISSFCFWSFRIWFSCRNM